VNLDRAADPRVEAILKLAVYVLLAAGLVSCLAVGAGGPADPYLREVPGPTASGRTPIPPFDEVRLVTTAGEFCALLADSDAERAQGLMERLDLGDYDAMVFTFDQDTTGRFWMRNTRIALSIAFFDESGGLVGTADMPPCPDGEECPTYGAERPYRTAVEVPQGDLDRLGIAAEGATVQVGGPCTPNRTS
jgi:uncharacterized protein